MTDITVKWWKAKGCTCPGDECSHCASSTYHDPEIIGGIHGEHCSRCGYSEQWIANPDGTRTVLQSSKDRSIDTTDFRTWKTVLG